jgi:hypothetical protein
MESAIDNLQEVSTLAEVFSFLPWGEVMNMRCVCQIWKEAATVAPIKELVVDKREIGLALAELSNALLGIRAFKIDENSKSLKDFIHIVHGEGAGASFQSYVGGGVYTSPPEVDLIHLHKFSGLQHLSLPQRSLRGSYPYIFRFQNLQSLDLLLNIRLVWDLELLSGLPSLRKLYCPHNYSLTGDLRSIRVLSKTLIELNLYHCEQVIGSLQDVEDFPLLEILDVDGTKISGDIRKIGPRDFLTLKELSIGKYVYGGGDLEIIEEAPSIMYAWYQLMKRFPPDLFRRRRWKVAGNSPDRYAIESHYSLAPPFWVEFVKIGPRTGWRWTNCVTGGCCEINWLDPEPSHSDEGYDEYRLEFENKTERDVGVYKGFHKPPTEQQHLLICADVPVHPILAREELFPTYPQLDVDAMLARYSSRSTWEERFPTYQVHYQFGQTWR